MGRLAADVRWFLSEDNFFRMGIWAEFPDFVNAPPKLRIGFR